MLSLDSTLSFGKFKGYTIKEIVEIEPTYICWCLENIENFNMNKDSVFLIKKLAECGQTDYESYENHYWAEKYGVSHR